jgi:hypothetical protein
MEPVFHGRPTSLDIHCPPVQDPHALACLVDIQPPRQPYSLAAPSFPLAPWQPCRALCLLLVWILLRHVPSSPGPRRCS